MNEAYAAKVLAEKALNKISDLEKRMSEFENNFTTAKKPFKNKQIEKKFTISDIEAALVKLAPFSNINEILTFLNNQK